MNLDRFDLAWSQRNGHQTFATIGLMACFALMMVLDTALG
jgi:ZIP family zinc transporter